jgi:hypothetical protein
MKEKKVQITLISRLDVLKKEYSFPKSLFLQDGRFKQDRARYDKMNFLQNLAGITCRILQDPQLAETSKSDLRFGFKSGY